MKKQNGTNFAMFCFIALNKSAVAYELQRNLAPNKLQKYNFSTWRMSFKMQQLSDSQ